MGAKPLHSSIERRFVMSILWVGVIPMTLALLSGYFAAREGQQIAVLQNLLTGAGKTADGVQLVIQERERNSARIAQSQEIVNWLKARKQGNYQSDAALHERLQQESIASRDVDSIFFLYDHEGLPVIFPEDRKVPDIMAFTHLEAPQFVDMNYSAIHRRYSALLVTPILDEVSNEKLGYLAESQDIQDLLALILGEDSGKGTGGGYYEIVIYTEEVQFVVNLNRTQEMPSPPPSFNEIHPRLLERIQKYPEREQDAFFLWAYTSRGTTQPALLAYKKIRHDLPVFIVVHRPTPDVFANINIAAAVTLVVSTLLIGVFCAIAYRIVNNSIIRPVSLLNEGAQIIRQGDLELKLKIETGDEIEDLASSFNQMAAALRANMRRLSASEEKYRSLVTSMRDGIFQTASDNKIQFINPSGVKILGYEQISDVLGKKLGDFFASENEFQQISGQLSQTPYLENVRAWLTRADGESICVELSASRIFDEQGNWAGLEGSFRDVTRNVRLEKEVAERAERIEAVNQIANVVNSSVEAGRVYENLICEVRRLMDFDYAAVALRLDDGGFETRQLWPEPREGHELFPRMDGEESCAAWVAREGRHLLITDLKQHMGLFRFQYPDGICSCLSVPLHAAENIIGALNFGSCQPDGFIEHNADMLKQIAPHLAAAIRNAKLLEDLKKSLEEVTIAREKLHRANEELKSLDEMKTNLLSNVSHELRTPLVAVMGYSDMILNGKAGPINDTQREYLGITLRNVEKLVALIENLLDFSRLHRGTEEMVFTRFDLAECIKASIQSVKPMADSRGIQIPLTLHDVSGAPLEPPVTVEGDKGKLGQVFNNLLSNAVKFNKTNGTVVADVEVRNDTVHIAVRDTGIGIPEEALDKIFTRFYQYDGSSTRKYGGTGIGLSIAQDIVRLHGSRLTVTSKVDEGSTFRFTLPLYIPPAAADGSNRKMALPFETHLLVELVTQERSLGMQIRQLLLSEGMDIIHAAYPDAVISMAQKYNPDCMIIDTESAPLVSQLLDDIIHEPLSVSTPIVLLTDDDEIYQRYQGHVSARVKRSFRKSSLLSGIHYALSRGAPTTGNLGNKILCVDDDDEITMFLSRCLANEGYAVDGCPSGEEALKYAEKGDYWLVLLDVAMPGIDGWETCRRLKANAELAGIKIYFVTAKAVDKQPSDIRDCGADGYLLKPFKSDDILAIVRSLDAQRSHSQYL